MNMSEDSLIKKLNKIRCQFGSLWWGREDFITERFDKWMTSDSPCHPLLSLKEGQIHALRDVVPMLVGRTAKRIHRRQLLINVQPDRKTDFGSLQESKVIFAYDFLYRTDDENILKDPTSRVWERQYLWPNSGKKKVTPLEAIEVKKFIDRQKNTTLSNNGRWTNE